MRKIFFLFLMIFCLSVPVFASGVDGEIAENQEQELIDGSDRKSSVPVLDDIPEESAIDETEELQNEIVFPEGPYAVYLVEPPDLAADLESEESLVPYVVGGSGYPGSISTSYIEYFSRLAAQLPVGTHYVFYRADRYTYRLVYGEDITLDGTSFSGSNVTVIDYDTDFTNATFDRYTDSSFSFDDPGYFVYTDLGEGYPKLFEGVSSRDFQAYFIVCVVFFLSIFIVRIFKY